jgi:hypothetical protein
MPDRFRHEIGYFMSIPGQGDVPAMPQGEYWIRRDDVSAWLEDGVLRVVSPLDSEHRTEMELSEEQEAWLEWMRDHDVQHVRLVGAS